LKEGDSTPITSIEYLVEEKFFHISDEDVNASNRKLLDPCTEEGEEINGIEIDCIGNSAVQRMLQFSVFHDSRNAETLYADPSNPDDLAVGNVIIYRDADLHSTDF